MNLVALPPFEPRASQRCLLRGVRKRNVACMGRLFGNTCLMQQVILNQDLLDTNPDRKEAGNPHQCRVTARSGDRSSA